MLFVAQLFITITFASNIALACEGECIVNVTKFILHMYSTPVYDIFRDIAREIENSAVPSSSRAANRLDYVTPLLSSYEGNAYSQMETSVFSSYFHGKCEDPTTGIAPSGCPNPSCPVVCGTPGSMAYHFPKLRRIAFDTVHTMLLENTREGSDTYNAVHKTVRRFAGTQAPNMTTRSIPRIFWARKDLDLLPEFEHMYPMKRADDVGAKLKPILESIPDRLARACGHVGPDEDGSVEELQGCSWKAVMVEYILQFP